MAAEEAIFYVIAELPCIAVAWCLKRFLGWPDKKAEAVAPMICIATLAGVCLVAWRLYISTA
jgi:hypothetical protein